MPVSEMVNVLVPSSTSTRMASSASGSTTSRLVSISNWIRFSASEALDTSSRKKISRSVYREWTRMLSSCWISALNLNDSVVLVVSLITRSPSFFLLNDQHTRASLRETVAALKSARRNGSAWHVRPLARPRGRASQSLCFIQLQRQEPLPDGKGCSVRRLYGRRSARAGPSPLHAD